MCKLLMVVGLMLTQLSCTQVVSIPLRAILDKPANVERIRTTQYMIFQLVKIHLITNQLSFLNLFLYDLRKKLVCQTPYFFSLIPLEMLVRGKMDHLDSKFIQKFSRQRFPNSFSIESTKDNSSGLQSVNASLRFVLYQSVQFYGHNLQNVGVHRN